MFREAFVQEKQRLVENAPSLASGSAGSVLASALNSKEQAGSNPIGRNSTENELGSKPYSRRGFFPLRSGALPVEKDALGAERYFGTTRVETGGLEK